MGGLLGDVFLHSLPEIWANDAAKNGTPGHPSLYSGLLILSGLMTFVATEKLFSIIESIAKITEENQKPTLEKLNNNTKELSPAEEKTDDANNKKHVSVVYFDGLLKPINYYY